MSHDSDFMGAVLHRFSQPLTALRGALELGLSLSRTPEQYREALQEALHHTDRLVRLKQLLAELTSRENFAAGSERLSVLDRKSTRLNSSHIQKSRMPSSA